MPLEHCPNCGGELKIIVAIVEQPMIEKIPTHLGLQARTRQLHFSANDVETMVVSWPVDFLPS